MNVSKQHRKSSFSIQPTEIPIKLEFSDLSYSVKKGKFNLRLMHGVSGSAFPGTLTAIMGPSGAGKSTLLNLLCGRVSCNLVQGSVYLNGGLRTKLSRLIIAYVMQEDIFFSELTVFETLKYTALLRLSKKLSYAEKMQRVEDVIEMLGLTKCRNTCVGGARNRGLSGGEKKRLNIANELLTNPSLFMLDEPTSGLDSYSASSVINKLYYLARNTKRTVICSIHQPSSEVFHRFDKLIGVMNGHIVYQGNVKSCNEYFSNLGFQCAYGYNLADHIINLFCDADKFDFLINAYRKFVVKSSNGEYNMTIPNISNKIEFPLTQINSSSLPENDLKEINAKEIEVESDVNFDERLLLKKMSIYKAKSHFTVEIDASNDMLKFGNNDHVDNEYETLPINELIKRHHDKPSYAQQTYTLLLRSMRKEIKDIVEPMDIFQAVLIALLVGCIWFDSISDYSLSRFNDRIGLFLFTTAYWTFVSAFSALTLFPSERLVIAKERASKSYKISSYLLAKSLAEIPAKCINPTIWILIVYPMVGYPWTAHSFFGIWFSILLETLVGYSIGMTTSALFNDFKAASVFVSVILLSSMLTSGFYVHLDLIPSWIVWLKWFSCMLFTMGSILQINLRGKFIKCDTGATADYTQCPIPGEEIIRKFNKTFDIWLNSLILLAMFITFKIITYLILRFSRKLRFQ